MARFRGLQLDEIAVGHIREYAADIQRRGYQTKPYMPISGQSYGQRWTAGT